MDKQQVLKNERVLADKPKDSKAYSIPAVETTAEKAYLTIQEILHSDSSPAVNLSSFSNRQLDEWGRQIVQENWGKNHINKKEYNRCKLIEQRLIWMMGDLLGITFAPGENDPDTSNRFYGTTTAGSSEAIMLGLIAHRQNWKAKNRINPKRNPLDKPFVLLSTHTHTCWAKYCQYFEVGAIYVPIEAPEFALKGSQVASILEQFILESAYREEILSFCEYTDESALADRTVGELVMAVGCVVGNNLTGNSDEVLAVSEAIDTYTNESGQAAIPIHVDAASAGFILPFLTTKTQSTIPFDFKAVPNVMSISISNHKFGLTLPGLGSIIFRNSQIVSKELIYDISYLGGSFGNFSLNFSRSAAMIILQYYNLIRLGRRGFQRIVENCLSTANYLVQNVAAHPILSQYFQAISDNERYPICVFKWKLQVSQDIQTSFATQMENMGWQIANYQLPTKNIKIPDGITVFRVVIHQHITQQQIKKLITDLEVVLENIKPAFNE